MGAKEVANLLMVANHMAAFNADDFLPVQGPWKDGRAIAIDNETGQAYLAWLTVDGRARVDFHGDLNALTLWEVEWDEKTPNRFWPLHKIHNRQLCYS